MKINIYKSEANPDHLLLVVEWPTDLSNELINFLKQVPAIDQDSIKAEKPNAIAFKIEAADEEEEKELKMAIISTIRRLLNDGKPPSAEERTTYLLSKEQMQGLLGEMEKLAQDNLALKGEVILRKMQERYLVIATGALFLTSIIALILIGLAMVTR